MIPIMLVEDEFLVRAGLKTCIPWNDIGYKVVAEAQDGETAMELYQKKMPRLIITDIRLPHMSGLDVMRKIRSVDEKARFIIISAFDDFKIAQKAIGIGVEGYFVKGNLDTDELVSMLQELKEKYFREEADLEDSSVSGQSFKEFYQKWNILETPEVMLQMEVLNAELYVVLFQIEEADVERFAEMVHIFFEQQEISHQFWVESRVTWFLVSPGTHGIHGLMEKVKVMVKRYVRFGLQIGISTNYYEKKELKDTIYEALLAAGSVQEPKEIVMEHYQAKTIPGVRIKHAVKQVEELLHMQRYEEARAEIRSLEILLKEYYSIENFYRAVYKLEGILAEYDDEIYRYPDVLEQLEVREIFKRMDVRVARIQQEPRSSTAQDNSYILNAKAYVYHNYQNAINIGSIAQEVHVSANYLGKIFLNRTGEYLTDFINQVRMEKAKELLAEHKYNINEVAAKVGVSDQRYFSKLFKKYFGMTPKEYANHVSTEL